MEELGATVAIEATLHAAARAVERGDVDGVLAMFQGDADVVIMDYMGPCRIDLAHLRVNFTALAGNTVGSPVCRYVEIHVTSLAPGAAFSWGSDAVCRPNARWREDRPASPRDRHLVADQRQVASGPRTRLVSRRSQYGPARHALVLPAGACNPSASRLIPRAALLGYLPRQHMNDWPEFGSEN